MSRPEHEEPAAVYELFEHTADLGLRVAAPDLNRLFEQAAEGLFSMIVEVVPPRVSGSNRTFDIKGDRRDYLLFDWLNELLYVSDTERLLLSGFAVQVDDDGLRATAWAEPLDPSRHRLLHEVKAITYHQFRVERSETGWVAEVIVDI